MKQKAFGRRWVIKRHSVFQTRLLFPPAENVMSGMIDMTCVCFEHLCGAERGAGDTTICYVCRTSPRMIAAFPRGPAPSKAILHPATMQPLTMCAYGLVFNQVCVGLAMSNVSQHRIIRNK
jgi:hypothetical protein